MSPKDLKTIALSIGPHGSESVATRIRAAILRLVRAGELRQGARLPAARELAMQTGVNRNTVQRIYRELTAEGVLESHVGDGTYVAHKARADPTNLRARARASLRESLKAALRLGFSAEEVEAMIEVELTDLRRLHATQGADLVRSRTRFSTWGKYSGGG